MDAATITAIGGFISGVVGVLIAVYTAANSAKATEVESLRCIIQSLQDENTRMSERLTAKDTRIEELEGEVNGLRKQVEAQGAENAALREKVAVLEARRRRD